MTTDNPLREWREELEALVADLEVDVDVAPHEVDALLKWAGAFIAQRQCERALEACR